MTGIGRLRRVLLDNVAASTARMVGSLAFSLRLAGRRASCWRAPVMRHASCVIKAGLSHSSTAASHAVPFARLLGLEMGLAVEWFTTVMRVAGMPMSKVTFISVVATHAPQA